MLFSNLDEHAISNYTETGIQGNLMKSRSPEEADFVQFNNYPLWLNHCEIIVSFIFL